MAGKNSFQYVFLFAVVIMFLYAFTVAQNEMYDNTSINYRSDLLSDILNPWLLSSPLGQLLLGFGFLFVAMTASDSGGSILNKPLNFARRMTSLPRHYFSYRSYPSSNRSFTVDRPVREHMQPPQPHRLPAPAERESDLSRFVPLAILGIMFLSSNPDFNNGISFSRGKPKEFNSNVSWYKVGVMILMLMIAALLTLIVILIIQPDLVKSHAHTFLSTMRNKVRKRNVSPVMTTTSYYSTLSSTSDDRVTVTTTRAGRDENRSIARKRKDRQRPMAAKVKCYNCHASRKISYMSVVATLVLALFFAAIYYTVLKDCHCNKRENNGIPSWMLPVMLVMACFCLRR